MRTTRLSSTLLALSVFALAEGCAVGALDDSAGTRAAEFDLETDDGRSCTEVYSASMTDGATHCPTQVEEDAGELTVDTNVGFLRTGFQRIDGLAVVEGDIVLGEIDEVDSLGGQAAGRSGAARLWPKGVVPYTISSTLSNTVRVQNAIAQWESATKLRFVKRTNETSWVTFRPGSGCSSMVGRMGGQQYINLASGCGTGAVIHEIGHAIGFWHEQSRPDRDKFISIRFENVTSGRESQFRMVSDSLLLGPYDIGSVMHYGPYGFSRNGRATITKKDGSLYSANRAALSEHDKAGFAKLYASQLGAPTPAPTPNPVGDTVDPNAATVKPTAGARFDAHSTIDVVAKVTDDTSVKSVELLWKTLGTTMACPGTGGAWSCTKSGDTYTWRIRVGSGDRRFSVRAKDAAGNGTESPERVIHFR